MTYTIESLAKRLDLDIPAKYWLWSKQNNDLHPVRSGKLHLRY
jgi:hypothetical protein